MDDLFIDETGRFPWPDERTERGALMADVLRGRDRERVTRRIAKSGDEIATFEIWSYAPPAEVNISAVKRGDRPQYLKFGEACENLIRAEKSERRANR